MNMLKSNEMMLITKMLDSNTKNKEEWYKILDFYKRRVEEENGK